MTLRLILAGLVAWLLGWAAACGCPDDPDALVQNGTYELNATSASSVEIEDVAMEVTDDGMVIDYRRADGTRWRATYAFVSSGPDK